MTMLRLLPAILLSAGLQSALAAPPPAAPVPTAAAATAAPRGDAIVQAQLLVPADPAPMARGDGHPAKTGVKAEAAHADDDRGVGGMLLAALALMTGIAVRRWGQGQQ